MPDAAAAQAKSYFYIPSSAIIFYPRPTIERWDSAPICSLSLCTYNIFNGIAMNFTGRWTIVFFTNYYIFGFGLILAFTNWAGCVLGLDSIQLPSFNDFEMKWQREILRSNSFDTVIKMLTTFCSIWFLVNVQKGEQIRSQTLHLTRTPTKPTNKIGRSPFSFSSFFCYYFCLHCNFVLQSVSEWRND